MKYAIDIDDESIKQQLMDALVKDGHTVVDCLQEKNLEIIESHQRKVILSNSTKAQVFLRFIQVEGDHDKLELFGDEEILASMMSIDLEGIVDDLELEQICFKNGKELYLIKNLDSLCIIVRLTTSNGKEKKKISKMLYTLVKEAS